MIVEGGLMLLFAALLIDWIIGDPDWLWSRLPHPVALFGKLVSAGNRHLNRMDDAPSMQVKLGSVLICILVLLAVVVGWRLSLLFSVIGWFGIASELLIVAIFLAQRSLFEHVLAVATGAKEGGISGARRAVAQIVGRNPESLDPEDCFRAAIESLAENFSDGVVAPAFWYAVFGLPGLFAYKMINTADSMIAYRNAKYLHFGRVTAQIDDLANWLPARLSAAVIAIGGFLAFGKASFSRSLTVAMQDARLHRSPNAGWPEAAMAGAIDVALGGPRRYGEEIVPQAHINASGKRRLVAADIDRALTVFRNSCFALWGGVLVLAILL